MVAEERKRNLTFSSYCVFQSSIFREAKTWLYIDLTNMLHFKNCNEFHILVLLDRCLQNLRFWEISTSSENNFLTYPTTGTKQN